MVNTPDRIPKKMACSMPRNNKSYGIERRHDQGHQHQPGDVSLRDIFNVFFPDHLFIIVG